MIDDLQQPPDGTADAYLRLHLLSHRLIKPHELNMDGIFAALPNVAWTSLGPVDPANLTHVQLKARETGTPLQVFSLDKFPRMTDYVDAVRRAGRRRRPRPPRRPPGRGHDGDARGLRELQRRHARALDGRGPDLRGRGRRRRLRRRRRSARSWARCRGGGSEVISIGERCLLGANAGIGISLGDDCTVEAGLYVTPARWSRCPTARSSRAAT